MLLRTLFRSAPSIALAFALSTALPFGFLRPAQAIPKAEAIQKLQFIPVYLLVIGDEDFVVVKQGDIQIASVYLDRVSADVALARLRSADPSLSASVKSYSLSDLYPTIERFQASQQVASNSTRTLFPIVANEDDTSKAFEILRADGLDDSVIKENLRVPVFYTEPMVNLNLNSLGKKQYFFLEYSVLQGILDQLPAGVARPLIKVMNLDQVLSLIIDQDEDLYGVYPTKEYFLTQPAG